MRVSMLDTACEKTEDDQVEGPLTWIENLHTSLTAYKPGPGLTPYESRVCVGEGFDTFFVL